VKKIALLLCIVALFILPHVDARVDAKFIIKDLNGRQIYMKTPEGKIVYGNVLVGQEIIFDASASNSMYPIDRYHWDFDGDGKYEKVTRGPIAHYKYNSSGIYYATLLAVASSAPPYGDGDTITHKIIVVEKLLPPKPYFTIKKIGNATFLFNASKSYDEDGYIWYYRWDFDGDGKYEKTGKEVSWEYKKNGYYVPTLEVMDYDLKSNLTRRVIKIDCLNGSINESIGTIKIENKRGYAINVSIVLNNNEKINITVEKECTIHPLLNPDINEIWIKAEGKEKIFVIEGNELKVAIDEDIYIPAPKTPSFGIFLVFISFILIILLKRK